VRRVGSIVLLSFASACSSSGPTLPHSNVDAGAASAPLEEASASRRKLREVSIAAPTDQPSSGTATFRLPSAIAEVPDRSGRYVMRRRDSATFFTQTGFAFALLHDRDAQGGWGLHCTLVGARDGALIVEKQQRARVHHYVGAKSSWSTDLPTYARLAWEEIRPGVDMVAEPARGGLAYRFVLSPGAKVSDLVMRWEGATALNVVDDGRGVDVVTGVGTLRVRGLRAFAIEGEQRIELPARHVAHDNEVGLEVDGWDGRTPLVIDPTIAWSSFLGGSTSDNGHAIAVDGGGNVLVVGSTSSSDFPTTGGFDTTLATSDAFVTKVSASGALLWSTYLGGGSNDDADGVAVDGSGNALVVGSTRSTDFPSTGGFDTTLAGSYDATLTKLSASGALLWSTYLGGGGTDFGRGVAVDGSGNAYLTGETNSADFPTSGGLDTTYAAPNDAFVTKVSASGTLLWSTYLGGSSGDEANAIAVDSAGNAFVTGLTYSSDFPTTGGFDTTRGGIYDGFVTKLTASGALSWSSYVGGAASTDEGEAVAVDGSGNVFVTGVTQSSDFPISGGFTTTLRGSDAFVMKLSASGALLWSSFLGGNSSDMGNGLAVDASGNVFVVGRTQSFDFPSGGGFDTSLGGSTDAFVTKVSGSGSLLWSSFLGGGLIDWSNGIALDGSGNAFVTGLVQSTDFPSGGGFDTSLGGAGDAFITKLGFGASGAPCTFAADCRSSFCAGVCCDKTCAGPCEACTAAKKGSGADGVCGLVAADSDPNDKCAAGTGTCASDGLCDGVGNCRLFAKAGTPCGATTCVAGAVTGKVCKGDSATCSDATNPCAPYACDAAACKKSCAADTDCATDAYCATTGVCITKLANGDACTDARSCASGFCVDGVCCNAKCDGQCEACDETKGTCKATAGAPRAGRAKCAGEGTACAGSCDGVNGGSCAYPAGKECSAKCAEGQQTIGRCTSAGACLDDLPQSCAGFACDAMSRCKRSCASSADCLDKYACVAGKCDPIVTKCTSDGTGVVDGDGNVTPCGVSRCKGGKCVEICATTEDCAQGYLCDGSKCVAPPPASTTDEGGCAMGRSANPNAIGALLAVLSATFGLWRRRRR